jgi:hypothetical protein
MAELAADVAAQHVAELLERIDHELWRQLEAQWTW